MRRANVLLIAVAGLTCIQAPVAAQPVPKDKAPVRASLDIRDATIPGALRLVAEAYRLSLVTGALPAERISLRLRDATAAEALEALAQAADIEVRREGDVLHARTRRTDKRQRVLLPGPFPPPVGEFLKGVDKLGVKVQQVGSVLALEGSPADVEAVRKAVLALRDRAGAPPPTTAPVRRFVLGPFHPKVESFIRDLSAAGVKIRLLGKTAALVEGAGPAVTEALRALQEVRDQVQKSEVKERVFSLGFAQGEETLAAIKLFLNPALEGAVYDKEGHLLTVTALPATLTRVEGLVDGREHPPAQIEIEARIYEISKTHLERIGADWALRFGVRGGIFPSTFPHKDLNDSSEFLPSANQLQGLANNANNNNNNNNQLATGGLADSGYQFSRLDASQMALFVEFLARSGAVTTVATPRITTLQNRQAKITITDTLRVPTFTLNATFNTQVVSGIERIEVGTTLDVKPRVGRDGTILLEVNPTVSERGPDLNGFPVISTRNASTEVILDRNETLVIGGLLRKREVEGVNKVPYLGEIPLIKHLFRFETKDTVETELLIFLTPRQLPSAKDRAGLERVDGRWIPRTMVDRLARGRSRINTLDPERQVSGILQLEALDGELLEHEFDVEPDVRPLLDSVDHGVRVAAGAFYARRRPVLLIPRLHGLPGRRGIALSLLVPTTPPHLRQILAVFLTRTPDGVASLTKRLERAIQTRDPAAVKVLLQALAIADPAAALKVAKGLLEIPSPEGRGAALDILARSGRESAARSLAKHAVTDASPELRVRNLSALFRLVGPEKASAAILALSPGPESVERCAIIRRFHGESRRPVEPPQAWAGAAQRIVVTGPGEETGVVEDALKRLQRDAPDYAHFVETAFLTIELTQGPTRVDPQRRALQLSLGRTPPERLAHRLVHLATSVFGTRVWGFLPEGARATAEGLREEVHVLERLTGTKTSMRRIDYLVNRVLAKVAPLEAGEWNK